ncbi:hypothetical protein NDU88_010819 [Pleurodeles waltl]|uniref:Uncharacterized protein n=1 Tax=Pleurodeles waltl TaxID=8319 RepID=A0AAV7S2Z4_PLEWA|nr:hypothetical protein NDU88_010819 [Pleurodeles waltl]
MLSARRCPAVSRRVGLVDVRWQTPGRGGEPGTGPGPDGTTEGGTHRERGQKAQEGWTGTWKGTGRHNRGGNALGTGPDGTREWGTNLDRD